MKISEKQATLATLAYADVFDFPLSKEELKRWLIFSNKPLIVAGKMEFQNNFFFLKGRGRVLKVRQRRNKEVNLKLQIAHEAARLLKIIPSISLVGVTGGLAIGNAEAHDDIDLFIIAQPGTLWITRFLSTLLVELSGRRRHPQEREIGNSICLNMFMTENNLTLSKEDRDLFSAHEVLQMQPLWQRGTTYKKFLRANAWAKTYLPNAWNERKRMTDANWTIKSSSNLIFGIYHFAFSIAEPAARIVQLWYMKRHRTTEVITDTVIRFHPKDARIWIKKKLGMRLKHLGIPLDSIFYSS